jgi:hypothetical protein
MLVSLYTVRVVLETLGAEDYGIYNVVAGEVLAYYPALVRHAVPVADAELRSDGT